MRRCLSILLVMLALSAMGQPDFDSLKAVAFSERSDSARLGKLYDLVLNQVEWSDDFDSTVRYAGMGLELSRKLRDTVSEGVFYRQLGALYSYNGMPEAISFFLKETELYDSFSQRKYLVRALHDVAAYYLNFNKFGTSLEYTQKALDIAEDSGCHDFDFGLYEIMGTVNYNLEVYGLAIDYYRKAKECCAGTIDTAQFNLHIAAAEFARSTDKYHAALVTEQAYNALVELQPQDADLVYMPFNEFSLVYADLDESDPRKDTVRAKLEHWLPVLQDLIEGQNMSLSYTLKLFYYILLDDRKMADKTASLLLSLLGNEDDLLAAESYFYISLYYHYIHDSRREFENLEKYYHLDAVMCNLELSAKNELLPVEKAYMEKMRKADNDARERDMLYQRQMELQSDVRYCMGVIGLFVLAFIVFLVSNRIVQSRQLRQLKVQTQEIVAANEELNTLHEEVLCQRDEITAHARELTIQRDRLSDYNASLIMSISFGERIQLALVPTEEALARMFPESFVLWKPCDIVSGDFFWIFMSESRRYVVTADCTGHGVPGALLSMLGISILNDISHSMDGMDAGQILDLLRSRVEGALTKNAGDMEDGMDVALYIITNYELRNTNGHPDECLGLEHGEHGEHRFTQNYTEEGIGNQKLKIKNSITDEGIENQKLKIKNVLSYAGANRPLVIVRGGEPILLKADKMSICADVYGDSKGSFHTIAMDVEPGDMVYSYSDGMEDQLGGPDGHKKYSRTRFRQLLASVAEKPMDGQLRSVESEIIRWSSTCQAFGTAYSQIDDQLLVGVRV